jgi:hypothetical protein
MLAKGEFVQQDLCVLGGCGKANDSGKSEELHGE